MTDIHNITEKITETLSSVLKKTNVFDKIDKTNSILFTISLFCIFGNIYSFINSITVIDVYKQNRKILKKIDHENFQLNNLIKLNNNIIKYINKSEGVEKKTVFTSTSDFEMYINKLKDVDELADECYDIIPCNNNKKYFL